MGAQDPRQRYLAGLLISLVVVVIGWQLLRWWTRPTAVEFDNLKYIQLLTTAVSSRNIDMVNKVETAVKQRFDAREMSEKELAHFQKLILMAREGQWEQADRGCFEFAKAQLNRSRARPAIKSHSHSHDDEHHATTHK